MDPASLQKDERRLAAKGARLLALPVISESRGKLSFGQYDTHLPFPPRRYFVVFDVPSGEVRGNHAHRASHQVYVCLRGTVMVTVDDGREREDVLLDGPQVGVYVPPMVWSTQHRFAEGAILLVLASDPYDHADYIRSYDDFLAGVGANPADR